MILLYIDPGAGSMLIQALLAAALAFPFVLRSAIARALARVRGRGDEGADADDTGGTTG